MSKIQKYTISVIPNFYWCHIAPDGFSSLLFPEHKIEFYFNGKMTASYTVKKESIPDVLPTYCYITEMLNKGSFSLSKESLDKLCSPEFREVLDYVKEMRLTHYYLGYIELTPSIYYYRYNKFHGEYAIEGKLYNIKKICCSHACYTTPRSIYVDKNNTQTEVFPNWINNWNYYLFYFLCMYFYYIISKKGHMNRGIIQIDDVYNPYEIINFCIENNFFKLNV